MRGGSFIVGTFALFASGSTFTPFTHTASMFRVAVIDFVGSPFTNSRSARMPGLSVHDP